MDEETQDAFRKLEDLLIAQHEQQLAATAELFAKLSAAMKELRTSPRDPAALAMSDLYDTDAVTWSRRQADALRRRDMMAIDWPNIIEEIESVGRAETDKVEELLTLAVTHKLRLLGWPEHAAADHRRAEIKAWLAQAARKHRASMHIDVAEVYADALLALEVAMLDLPLPIVDLPPDCPWTLDELLDEGRAARRR